MILLASREPMVRRRTRSAQEKDASTPALGAAPARRGGAWLIAHPRCARRRQPLRLRLGQEDRRSARSSSRPRRTARRRPPCPRSRWSPLPPPPRRRRAVARPPSPRRPPRSARRGTIDGKVGKSDTLGKLLKKSGLSAAEADEIIRALSGVLDFKAIRAGQTFRIERGARRPREAVRARSVSKVHTVRAERGADGELVGKADDSQTRIEVKTIGGRIDSSLYAAIKASGETGAARRLLRRRVRLRPRLLQRHPGRRHVPRRRREGVQGPGVPPLQRILAAEYQGKAGTLQDVRVQGRLLRRHRRIVGEVAC